MSKTYLAIATTLAIIALNCNDSDTVTGPSPASSPMISNPIYSRATTSPEILAAMERAIQDEYHAENVYLGVIADFGDVLPFSRIVNAEQRHSETIARLYRNRGLPVPKSQGSPANVPRFATVAEACKAAVRAERENISLYDGFLKLDLPRDVRNVFTNNRRASLKNHLPAFQNCDCAC